MSYKELLAERDSVLEDIYAFENHTYDPALDMIDPSPDVRYQWNLEYLGKLLGLIAEKYCSEFEWGEE